MSELEIRAILRAVCDDLDRQARAFVRHGMRRVVVPAALGAGLALAGGGCGDERPAVDTDAGADITLIQEAGPGDGVVYMGPDAALYAAPDMAYWGPDAGPVPPYMGPDAGGVLYAAPDSGPPPVDMGGLVYSAPDAGPTPPYMAPDGGVAPLYAGPMTDMGPPLPPYMAPDMGTKPKKDVGPQPLYMAPQPPPPMPIPGKK